jgi:quercetin dioxygenase-like cupin family protein
MENHKVLFNNLPWNSTGTGVRSKTYVDGSRRVRMVEFSEGFEEDGWCTKGHAGIVLEGAFSVDFNGIKERFQTGDIIHIQDGEQDKHRAILATGEKVLIVFFES